ncbi:HEPN domain-containing protein [Massilia genomosp. 1]|nr:HEPN domain-containing protein [Massilia genomosp. 1]
MADTTGQGYIYAFNVSDTEQNFSMLPDDVQFQIEKEIVDVIFESFVMPADHDYLAARALAIGGLNRSFFWSASQTVEKYIKAFLLLQGVSIRPFSQGHGLKRLLEEARKVEADFDCIDLAPHPGLQLPNGGVGLVHFNLASYIAELEKQGSASNRYNNYGERYNTGHLFALDSLAYSLRNKMGLPDLADSFRGRLSTDFRRYLYDNNPYWAPADFTHTVLPSAVFPIRHATASTTWGYVKKRQGQSAAITRSWITTKMKIE